MQLPWGLETSQVWWCLPCPALRAFFLSQLLRAPLQFIVVFHTAQILEEFLPSPPFSLEAGRWNKAALMAAVITLLAFYLLSNTCFYQQKLGFFPPALFHPFISFIFMGVLSLLAGSGGVCFHFPLAFFLAKYGLNILEKRLLWFGPTFQESQVHLHAVKRILPLPPSPREEENKKKLFIFNENGDVPAKKCEIKSQKTPSVCAIVTSAGALLVQNDKCTDTPCICLYISKSFIFF